MLDICFLRFKWKIANILARLWQSAHFCHWAIFPSSAANFRPVDRWNRKSQIIPNFGRIFKFKTQQCYKLIKTLLQTENEFRLGFELWPRFADFAQFFCAFALKECFALHNDKNVYLPDFTYFSFPFRAFSRITKNIVNSLFMERPVVNWPLFGHFFQ